MEAWQNALPKRRPLKRTDRICNRHFDPSDVLTHWDHTINGKVVKMERDKVMLKPNAVPSLNLSETDTQKVNGTAIRIVKEE